MAPNGANTLFCDSAGEEEEARRSKGHVHHDGPSDHTDITEDNIVRPDFEALPEDERKGFDELMQQVREEAKRRFCSNFEIDRFKKVIKGKDFDVNSTTRILVIRDVPNLS